MAIVVEDGTNVANANSFVTEAELTAYLSERGIVPTGSLSVALIKAMDYIRSVESRLQGSRSYTSQRLPFPRTGLYLRGDEFPRYSIPEEVKTAQMEAALQVVKGVDLMPTVVPGTAVKRKKIGPLEKEFFDPGSTGSQPQLTSVESILSILFGATSGAFLTLRRV